MPKKSRQKLKDLELSRWNKNEIKSIFIFEGLSLKEIKEIFFGRWESDFNDNENEVENEIDHIGTI